MRFRVVRTFPAVALSTQKVYRVESVELLSEDDAEKLAETFNGAPLSRYKDIHKEEQTPQCTAYPEPCAGCQ